MSPFDTQNPPLIPYSKLLEHPSVSSISLRPPVTDNYQTPRSDGSGPLSPGEWPGGFQADYSETWANTRIPDTQTTTGVTGYYSTQSTPGDAPVGNSHHRSSPFYQMPTRVDTMVQPTNYQSYDTQYPSEGQTSYPQDHSPSPSQPTNYPSLLTSPQSDPSYSHPIPNQLQSRQSIPVPGDHQWPPPHVPSNSTVPDPIPVAYHHNYADSQSQVYSPVVVSSGNSGQSSTPTSSTQPSSFGEAPPYQPCPSYPPTDGPSFSVSHHSLPTRVKGKRAGRIHPYSDSGRKPGKKVSLSNERPVASSSRVTLDPPPPPTAPRGKRKHQTLVSVPDQALLIVVDLCISKAHERDAERKKGYRGALRDWFNRVDRLLQPSGLDSPSRLQILSRGKYKTRLTQTGMVLTGNPVIERLSGVVPALVDQPKKTTKRKDAKSFANGVRAHNEDRSYDEVRRLLQARGYRVDAKTSYLSLLQIGALIGFIWLVRALTTR